MKSNCLKKAIQSAVACSFAVFALTHKPATAEGGPVGPLDVQASLSTRPTIVQGDPIILHYRISNTSDQKVGMHWGVYRTEWYTLHLTDAAGRMTSSLADPRPRDPQGLHASPQGFLASGKGTDGFIVVSRFLAVPRPGRYTLTMRVHISYAIVEPEEENPVRLKGLLQDSGTNLTQDYTFPLIITASNTDRLRSTAEALCQSIIQEKYGPRHKALMEALFSMPEAQAAASWEALASKPSMDADLIAHHLEHVHSPKAADILARMLRDPTLSPDNLTAVGRRLNEMYNTGNAKLREHIKQIAASYRITLPNE